MRRATIGRKPKPTLVAEHHFSVQRVGGGHGRGGGGRLVEFDFVDPRSDRCVEGLTDLEEINGSEIWVTGLCGGIQMQDHVVPAVL